MLDGLLPSSDSNTEVYVLAILLSRCANKLNYVILKTSAGRKKNGCLTNKVTRFYKKISPIGLRKELESYLRSLHL